MKMKVCSETVIKSGLHGLTDLYLIVNGDFKEILCIGTDITELKRAEQEKRDLEARLQRAQKMEAIGTLAGGVAHDLNNILSGIVSYPELLLMDIPSGQPIKKPDFNHTKGRRKSCCNRSGFIDPGKKRELSQRKSSI